MIGLHADSSQILCPVILFHSVGITFVDRNGVEHTVQGQMDRSLMEVAKDFNIDLEGRFHSQVYNNIILILILCIEVVIQLNTAYIITIGCES